MKVIILAGGLGSRISEESYLKPKPMIEIGGHPILWHIMKIYTHYGLKDFIILCGYKAHVIKEYFANYYMYNSDVTYDFEKNSHLIHNNTSDPWKVTVVDTGLETQTGGRLKRVLKYLNPNEPFCFTYGDGVCNVNIKDLINFHYTHKKLATITAVRIPNRFGLLNINNSNKVDSFVEKPINNTDGGADYINGGFFVLNTKVIDYIDEDHTLWEKEPLQNIAKDGELMAFKHNDFWQPMDTLREKNILEKLWEENKAPWKIW